MKNIFSIKPAVLIFCCLICLSANIYGQSDAFPGQRHSISSNDASATDESDNTGVVTKHKKKYYQDGKKLSNQEFRHLILSNPEGAKQYNSYKTNHTCSTVFIVAGSVLYVGGMAEIIAAGRHINSSSDNQQLQNSLGNAAIGYVIAIGGVVVGASSIAFMIPAKRYLTRSVKAYNYNANGTSYNGNEIRANMSFNIYPGRVGLVVNF